MNRNYDDVNVNVEAAVALQSVCPTNNLDLGSSEKCSSQQELIELIKRIRSAIIYGEYNAGYREDYSPHVATGLGHAVLKNPLTKHFNSQQIISSQSLQSFAYTNNTTASVDQAMVLVKNLSLALGCKHAEYQHFCLPSGDAQQIETSGDGQWVFKKVAKGPAFKDCLASNDFPVVVTTGDQSLVEALCAGKFVFYEVCQHKVPVMFALVRAYLDKGVSMGQMKNLFILQQPMPSLSMQFFERKQDDGFSSILDSYTSSDFLHADQLADLKKVMLDGEALSLDCDTIERVYQAQQLLIEQTPELTEVIYKKLPLTKHTSQLSLAFAMGCVRGQGDYNNMKKLIIGLLNKIDSSHESLTLQITVHMDSASFGYYNEDHILQKFFTDVGNVGIIVVGGSQKQAVPVIKPALKVVGLSGPGVNASSLCGSAFNAAGKENFKDCLSMLKK